MLNQNDADMLEKAELAAYELVQYLRDMTRAGNPLLADIALESLQQSLPILQRLSRLQAITKPEETNEPTT